MNATSIIKIVISSLLLAIFSQICLAQEPARLKGYSTFYNWRISPGSYGGSGRNSTRGYYKRGREVLP